LHAVFGLRRQSAAATALSGVDDERDDLSARYACESGVALRLPPQSKMRPQFVFTRINHLNNP